MGKCIYLCRGKLHCQKYIRNFTENVADAAMSIEDFWVHERIVFPDTAILSTMWDTAQRWSFLYMEHYGETNLKLTDNFPVILRFRFYSVLVNIPVTLVLVLACATLSNEMRRKRKVCLVLVIDETSRLRTTIAAPISAFSGALRHQ